MKSNISKLEVNGKRIFVRGDLNVPLNDGVIQDDTRLMAVVPTVEYLLSKGATIVLASHLGRPKGKRILEYSLRPVAKWLEDRFKRPVEFIEHLSGAAAKVENARSGGHLVLLENLRFYEGETANDDGFAEQLSKLVDGYVNDAFGTCHRRHASVHALPQLFRDSTYGFLVEKELQFLNKVLKQPQHPYVAIVGGAKVSDKLGIVKSLLRLADAVLIGGAMAYTFLKAKGSPIGKSLCEEDQIDNASSILEQAAQQNKKLLLPIDHRVAAGTTGPAEVVEDIPQGMIGFDIGLQTEQIYAQVISTAKMIVWNGPMGMFEVEQFSHGTFAVAQAVADSQAISVVGGGDSVSAINRLGVAERITHISTGGGASLSYLKGDILPGLEVIGAE